MEKIICRQEQILQDMIHNLYEFSRIEEFNLTSDIGQDIFVYVIW
jgi:hypothetical protein